jgi:hypothetical protein
MISLKRGDVYEFRGKQLRYSHKSKDRFVFTGSNNKRIELSQENTHKEVYEIRQLSEQ